MKLKYTTMGISFGLFFSLIPCYGLEPSITLHVTRIDQINEPALKNVYFNAFKTVYANDWDAHLEQKVCKIFEDYIEKFMNSSDMILVTANQESNIVGWALFLKDDQKAVLEILCIDPQVWRQGIGKKLVFSICDYFPEISHISLVTRKINVISPHFYEALGFKKTNLELPEYISGEMQGYEWSRDDAK